jgi:hypothetical protein
MQLIISGRQGAHTCSWKSYALLHEDVLALLEQGQPSGRFQGLHSIRRAASAGPQSIDAVRLRLEALQVRAAVAKVRLARKRARSARPQSVAGDSRPPLPRAARRILRSILALTTHAVAGDRLEVRLQEEGPPREKEQVH